MKTLEYNYRDLTLTDLRYRGNDEKGYYILAFTCRNKPIFPVNINKSIFETVLYKYFTPLFKPTREDLFKLKWCAHLSEGKYYQWQKDGGMEYKEIYGSDSERIYVSRLDIVGDLDDLTYNEANNE